VGVDTAGFGEGKEPLDEVVDGFEAVVVPGENLLEGAALVVGCSIAIVGDQRRWVGGAQRWIQPLRIISRETLPTATQRRTP